MKVLIVLATLLFSSLSGWSIPLLLQDPDFTDLAAVLTWLAGAGGPYFVGWVLSLLAENWPAWHDLPRSVKFAIPLIASPIVAILATLALQQAAILEFAAPWYTIIAGSILGYLGTQQAYLRAKQAGYGQQVRG